MSTDTSTDVPTSLTDEPSIVPDTRPADDHARTHAAKPSVANAASLFGADGDLDPFSSIAAESENEGAATSQAPALSTLREESEPGPGSHTAPAPLQVPDAAAHVESLASPSGLFGDATGAGAGTDDWLGETTAQPAEGVPHAAHVPAQDSADPNAWPSYEDYAGQEAQQDLSGQYGEAHQSYGAYGGHNAGESQGGQYNSYDPSQPAAHQFDYGAYDASYQQGYDGQYAAPHASEQQQAHTNSYAAYDPSQQQNAFTPHQQSYDAIQQGQQGYADYYSHGYTAQDQATHDTTASDQVDGYDYNAGHQNGYDQEQASRDYAQHQQPADGYATGSYGAQHPAEYDAQYADGAHYANGEGYEAQSQQSGFDYSHAQYDPSYSAHDANVQHSYQPQHDPYAPSQGADAAHADASQGYARSDYGPPQPTDYTSTAQYGVPTTGDQWSYSQQPNGYSAPYAAGPSDGTSALETASPAPSISQPPPKGPPRGPPKGPPRQKARVGAELTTSATDAAPYAAGPGAHDLDRVEHDEPTRSVEVEGPGALATSPPPQTWANNLESAVSPPPRRHAAGRGPGSSIEKEPSLVAPPSFTFSSYDNGEEGQRHRPTEDIDQTPPANAAQLHNESADAQESEGAEGAAAALRELDLDGNEDPEASHLADESSGDTHRVYNASDPENEAYGSYAAGVTAADVHGAAYNAFGDDADAAGQSSSYEPQHHQPQYGYEQAPEPYGQETHVSQYNPYAPRNAGVTGPYEGSNASSSAISEDAGYGSHSTFQNGHSPDQQFGHEETPYSAVPPSSQYAAFRHEVPQINHPGNADDDPYADEAPTPRSAYIPAPGRDAQDGSQTAPARGSAHDANGALSPWSAGVGQEARVLTPSSGGTTIQPPTAFKKRIRDLDPTIASNSANAYSPSQQPATLPPSTAMSWAGPSGNGTDSPNELYSNTGLGRSGTVTQRSVSSHTLHTAPVGGTDSNSYFALQQSSTHLGSSPGNMAGAASSLYGASSTDLHGQYASGHQREVTDAVEERRQARIGIASFGLDGKLVAFLPNAAGESGSGAGVGTPYGFGAAASGMNVRITSLSAAVSSHTYGKALDFTRFPGPLFDGTPGAATGGALSRGASGTTAGAKAKKTALISFLNEAVIEMERGVGYLKRRRPSFAATTAEGAGELDDEDGAPDGQRAEDRVLLMRLLLLMLEHDGNTLNNPAFDAASRALLLEGVSETPSANNSFGVAGLPYGSNGGPNTEQVLQTYTLRSTFLDRIQSLLRAGERNEAVSFAIEQRMWAHAMVIASSVDRELWKSVVEQFTDFELGAQFSSQGPAQPSEPASHHSLHVAYALFSGQESSIIAKSFRSSETHAPSIGSGARPVSTQKAAPRWREAAATILANKGVSGDSAALTAMGDGLSQGGWIEAAHICYLLSPQTAALDGVDGPGVRLTLLGARSPAASTDYLRDLDHIQLTEIYEFIGSLRPIAKGGEAYPGLPHLQAFKMLHAHHLAELGDIKGAQKYCDAVANVLKGGKMSRHYHHAFVGQLKELTERLNGGAQDSNGAGSGWMTRKISQRPTMDGMWSMLEGRFTKFVAGEDGESGGNGKANAKGAGSRGRTESASGAAAGAIGPFSHYSAITPDNTSGNITRVQSSADFQASNVYGRSAQSGNGSLPPSRAGSAMAFERAQTQTPLQSSGFEASYPYGAPYSAGGSEWGLPPTASSMSTNYSAYANPSHTPDPYSSDRGSEADYGAGPYTSHGATSNAPWPAQGGVDGKEIEEPRSALQPPEEPYYGYQPHGAQQPQFFSNVGGESSNVVESEDGFISTMGASFGAPVPTAPSQTQPNSGPAHFDEPDDEEDDLGFGNASTAKRAKEREAAAAAAADNSDNKAANAPEKPRDEPKAGASAAKPEIKSSGSWLGRIWGRKEVAPAAEPPGGHKAHLGEESVFYYDKDLKKWVNKKAGSSAPTAAATPPPPRAQTASPSVGGPSAAQPPSRAPSAMSMSATYSTTAGPPSSRSTPPPPISEEVSSSPESASKGLTAPPPSAFRQRSNLGDPNLPPATQPPMLRSASNASMVGGGPPGPSATPPPPLAGATGTVGRGSKKRPIASRYVKVDP